MFSSFSYKKGKFPSLVNYLLFTVTYSYPIFVLYASLTNKPRTLAGKLLDLNLVRYGNFMWVRCSNYTKSAMNSGVTYTINQFSENPILGVNRRYVLNSSADFVIDISTDGTVKITPTAAVPKDTAINFSEFVLVP